MQHKQNWTNIAGVRVITRDAKTFNYNTIQEAVRKHGNYCREGKYLSTWYPPGSYYSYGFWGHGESVLYYTNEGMKIPSWKIEEVYIHLFSKYRVYYKRKRDYTFRDGPVPGIRNRYGRWRGRYPKTFQEIRENEGLYYDEDAIEYNIIGRRKKGNVDQLPTCWDDIYRNFTKNWKKFRNTQYKTKKPESDLWL